MSLQLMLFLLKNTTIQCFLARRNDDAVVLLLAFIQDMVMVMLSICLLSCIVFCDQDTTAVVASKSVE